MPEDRFYPAYHPAPKENREYRTNVESSHAKGPHNQSINQIMDNFQREKSSFNSKLQNLKAKLSGLQLDDNFSVCDETRFQPPRSRSSSPNY